MMKLRATLLLLPVVLGMSCREASKPSIPATNPATRQIATTNHSIRYRDETYSLGGLQSQNRELASDVRTPDTEVLVSFFNTGRISCMQHCYILKDGERGMIRFVRNWAIQSGGPKVARPGALMPKAQSAALKAAIQRLPLDIPFKNDEDAFIVSWNDSGTWRTRIYDRTRLQPEVLKLCQLVGIPTTWF